MTKLTPHQSHLEASRLANRLAERYRTAILAKPADRAERAQNEALIDRLRRISGRAMARSARRWARYLQSLRAMIGLA